LQHLEPAAYRRWKRGLAVEALSRQGFPGDRVADLQSVGDRGRRRAVFAAHHAGNAVAMGFHRRMSHNVVDLRSCLVVAPSLFALLDPLRELLARLIAPAETGDVAVLDTETGPDILLISKRAPALEGREAAAAFASQTGVARISWAGSVGEEPELLAQHCLPVVRFGGIAVTPPPGGFLQPTADGEAMLRTAVLDGLGPEDRRVADLYAGCGTFTFPIVTDEGGGRSVVAVEGDSPALQALSRAARTAGIGSEVTAVERDLARQPLLTEELNAFDAVVFDPPRAGASEQSRELAQSKVRHVVAVSCNPASLARDLRILTEGGYALDWVRPIDQFPWTPHLELVARLSR
jgi:23S rRNA (uracil1939-C5)-methyltransferase